MKLKMTWSKFLRFWKSKIRNTLGFTEQLKPSTNICSCCKEPFIEDDFGKFCPNETCPSLNNNSKDPFHLSTLGIESKVLKATSPERWKFAVEDIHIPVRPKAVNQCPKCDFFFESCLYGDYCPNLWCDFLSPDTNANTYTT